MSPEGLELPEAGAGRRGTAGLAGERSSEAVCAAHAEQVGLAGGPSVPAPPLSGRAGGAALRPREGPLSRGGLSAQAACGVAEAAGPRSRRLVAAERRCRGWCRVEVTGEAEAEPLEEVPVPDGEDSPRRRSCTRMFGASRRAPGPPQHGRPVLHGLLPRPVEGSTRQPTERCAARFGARTSRRQMAMVVARAT